MTYNDPLSGNDFGLASSEEELLIPAAPQAKPSSTASPVTPKKDKQPSRHRLLLGLAVTLLLLNTAALGYALAVLLPSAVKDVETVVSELGNDVRGVETATRDVQTATRDVQTATRNVQTATLDVVAALNEVQDAVGQPVIIDQIVETGIPRDAQLLGLCYRNPRPDSYDFGVEAYAGGRMYTVITRGDYNSYSIEGFAPLIAEYFGGGPLTFGEFNEASEECDHLDGFK